MPGSIIDVISAARIVRASLVAVALILFGATEALAAPGVKVVDYHGYRVTIPRAWPVYDLAKDPATCVRFNRHALYLGHPGAIQHCPAHAAGRTAAILLQLVAGRVRITATWSRDGALIRRALGRRSLKGLSGAAG